MVFNFWRPYPFLVPKKSGWYICTAAHQNGIDKPGVIELYFDTWHNKWVDLRRQNVFDGYKVYESCREPIDDNRVYTDTDCERIDVIAWKHLPRYYGYWKKKRGSNHKSTLWEEMDGR